MKDLPDEICCIPQARNGDPALAAPASKADNAISRENRRQARSSSFDITGLTETAARDPLSGAGGLLF